MPEELQHIGKIENRILETEMQESYLDYAMSVIVARALPDVRDGLKPVHRRILYAMHDMGLKSNAKFRKSATVVGEVLGKYHPHGDLAVYETMVRMAQNFSMRYTLVDGQGNFGSMDGDPAAAHRYTEARMSAISEELLVDIEKETVNFIDNYDGTRKEPQVLPARLPNLLLNGQMGIAVGMATNIPPHNLSEICDGIVCLIDNPEASVEDLMRFVTGPDFPTGGEIYNNEEIKNAYAVGKGRIVMRGVAEIEETKKGFRVIIKELPYQVNKADLITKIADLVKEKKLDGISDIRDESDRSENVRIVIELKSSAFPKKILNRLFDLTALQSSFNVNMLALLNGIQPRVMSLKNILDEYVLHRKDVVKRRTIFDLKKAKEREHILEGLKKALDHIDEIIALIKASKDRDTAEKNLIEKFEFSEIQANAILEMRLAQLAALEREKINKELDEIKKLIAELESILASDVKIAGIVKKETLELKEKFGDKRRTKVFKKALGDFSAEDLIPNESVIVSLSKDNYVKRVPIDTFRAQGRGGKGVVGQTLKEEDTIEHLVTCETHDDMMFFTNKGRVFTAKVYDLPSTSRQAKGQAIVNLLQISPEEKVTAISASRSKENKSAYFMMATKFGVIKKTLVDAYRAVRKSGMIAIKLRPGDELRWAKMTSGKDNIILVSKLGQSIYFEEEQVRSMGRSAGGVRGIKLRKEDELIAMGAVPKENPGDLLTILENGFGKRTSIAKFYRTQNRGGFGVRASRVSAKTGNLTVALIVEKPVGDLVMISQSGQVIRIPLTATKNLTRDSQGVTLMRLNKGDKVATVTLINNQEKLAVEEPKPIEQIEAPEEVKEILAPVEAEEIEALEEVKEIEVPKEIEKKKDTGQKEKNELESSEQQKSTEVDYWSRKTYKNE